MIQGLQSMSEAEISEVARLTGVDDAARASLNPSQLLGKIVGWIGYTAQCQNPDVNAIERAALEMLAHDWGLTHSPTQSTDDLERSLRIKIAADAAEYLAPSWWLAIAFAIAGPKDAIAPKLAMLEKAASLAVPSQSARQNLLQEWQKRCQEAEKAQQPMLGLEPSLAILRTRSERVEQALTLALVIALADGRLAADEERMFKDLAADLGRSPDQITEVLRRVNNLYWHHQSAVGPKDAAKVDAAADKAASLKAAQLTLDASGALEGLVLEARDNVATADKAPKAAAPKSGWQRMLGSLSGLTTYLSSRDRSHEQTTLARIVYLAILRQHSQVTAKLEAQHAAAASRAAAAAHSEKKVEILGEVEQNVARRAIKLDP